MAAKGVAIKLQFLQAQMQYYASHLNLADAKAAGITVFAVAISAATANKMTWNFAPVFFSSSGFAWVGLAFALLTVAFAFLALWPRYRDAKAPYGIFGWVDVAANKRSNKRGKPLHAQRTKTVSATKIIEGMAMTAEDLATVIAKKYYWIKRATISLVPTTLAHVAFWVVS